MMSQTNDDDNYGKKVIDKMEIFIFPNQKYQNKQVNTDCLPKKIH